MWVRLGPRGGQCWTADIIIIYSTASGNTALLMPMINQCIFIWQTASSKKQQLSKFKKKIELDAQRTFWWAHDCQRTDFWLFVFLMIYYCFFVSVCLSQASALNNYYVSVVLLMAAYAVYACTCACVCVCVCVCARLCSIFNRNCVQAIFFSEFHHTAGPVVSYQVSCVQWNHFSCVINPKSVPFIIKLDFKRK